MNFIVTGGAGFIGSNLVKRLVERGNSVTVIDNLHTGSLDNLSEVKEKIEFIKSDIDFRNIGRDIDGVFHLGIPSSSPMYKDDKMLFGNAVNDMIKVLEFARENDSRVVFASSSSLYSQNEPPHSESMGIKTSDYYTEARMSMERLSELYNKLYGTGVIGLRFFSVYGRNEESKGRYANLISQFIWNVRENKNPVIYGNGEQRRDFIFVEDVVNACLLSMESDIGYGIFNIGTGKSYSLNEMIKILAEIMNAQIKPDYIENPIKNYVECTQADTNKSEKLLNFKSRYELHDGIKECLGL